MVERLLVIGGDAAGMSAASQAKRLRGDALDVIALERGSAVSYSACGIPYWISGVVDAREDLIARSAQEHRDRGIDVRLHHEAVGLDLDARVVTARDPDGGEQRIGFDQLMIGTGAVPARPPIPGIDAEGVFGVQTLDDGSAVIAALADGPQRAVVIGGGYIGVEMAEAMVVRGLSVTILDSAPEPMTTLDPDMGRLVHEAIEGMGVDVRTGSPVETIETADGRARAVTTADATYDANIVIIGLGVRPNTSLAETAGLPLGDAGGLRPDRRMRVPDVDGVWAAGDCTEVMHRISQRWVHIPLGTHANKQGRVAGTNIGGGYATFPGVLGTAISKVCDLEIGRTGLGEQEAEDAGFACLTTTVESTTRAGYFPGTKPITVKLIVEKRTGRLLGAQVVGREDAAKRIDAAAVAIWNGMTVEEIAGLDLGYAPPFAPVWDPTLIAARKAADQVAADLRGHG